MAVVAVGTKSQQMRAVWYQEMTSMDDASCPSLRHRLLVLVLGLRVLVHVKLVLHYVLDDRRRNQVRDA